MTKSPPATLSNPKPVGIWSRSLSRASAPIAAGARTLRRLLSGTMVAVLGVVGLPILPGAVGVAAGDASARIGTEQAGGRTDPPGAADTLRIRLALASRLHVPWARAEIIRPTDPSRRDVIVLTTESTLADLEKAVRLLASSHSTQPKPLEWEIRGHVSATAQQPEPGPMLDRLAQGLRELPDGASANISEHGDLPSVEIDLAVEIESSDPGS